MSVRPERERKSSRVPGSFDTGDDVGSMSDDPFDSQNHGGPLPDSSFQPASHDGTSLLPPFNENSAIPANSTVMEERAMNRKLMDVESSFLPELSHLAAPNGRAEGADDTLAFGVLNDNLAMRRRTVSSDGLSPVQEPTNELSDHNHSGLRSPQTPPGAYKTPAPEEQQWRDDHDQGQEKKTPEAPNTSSLETMSSSPTATAAARTVSRVQSMATMGGYETADERHPPGRSDSDDDDPDVTPRKNQDTSLLNISPTRQGHSYDGNADSKAEFPESQSKRPKYLNSRTSHQRLSYSSLASTGTDASDVTLGADFALQSGGALPEPRLQRKGKMTLSRSTSLGSIMSGISATSDEDGKARKPASGNVGDLSTLQEESNQSSVIRSPVHGPLTPKASINRLTMPTDTVIANNVRDIEVPGTFARQYRQQQQDRNQSPEKALSMAGMTPGPKRGMTLKEHRSTVERLGKENFDLKMKIHFLDQALQSRSEDGVKEMIVENVQLKSDRLRLEKDNHSLKKQIRELQKKLDARESPSADQGYGTDEERSPTAEEEVIYLRERLETNEIEIEKLRSESMARESEKRRLAEMVRSLGDTRTGTSDVGSREERDMWKDMLEAETIAREQSEEDNKRLREEISKLRHESFGQGRSLSRRQRIGGSVVSRSSSTDGRNGVKAAELVEMERLKHEVSELQKMIGAQASTLTSRNKEKERLYQEIEDLKMGRMGGVRSVAGDSIFERSASRARSYSRASNGTRASRLSNPERESLETKIGELRDQVSELKLGNQNLQNQLDEVLAELDAVDAQAQADADQFNEELHLLTEERDQALQDAEEQENAFQNLRNEYQQEVDGLGDELDAKLEECARLEEDLKTQSDNVKALQAEMRSASEGLIRLEEDAQNNLARYQQVQGELDDAHRELDGMQKALNESETKIQRLTVQQESSHNEIAFLREEQDGDKIKIGDLEALMKKVHLNLDLERDKTKELDRSLTQERQQRETVESTSKAEIQRVINDLNREAAAAKEDARRIKKALSSREIEANTWKERLMELEDNLRQAVGDANGTRASLLSSVTKMQRELDQTTVDLDATRRRLDEKEALLTSRDALLETSGLEYRKLTEILDRERQGRRQDKHSFEQSLKSHQQSARALSANNSRLVELEQARQADRRKISQLEAQFKEQLQERNSVLLNIWKRLSAMCGPDWAHNNSLINGNLPSQEVIGNMLFWPGFSRNLLLAVKQVEGTLSTFKDRIKRVERDLWKEYTTLEHTLDLRTKKLERIEQVWENMKSQQSQVDGTPRASKSKTPEMQKLKGENRLLKAELSLLQQQHSNAHFRAHSRGQSRNSVLSGGMSTDGASSTNGGIPQRGSSMRGPSTMIRHHTTNVVEHLYGANNDGRSMRSNSISSRTSTNRPGGELMIPAGPFQAPPNGNFPAPPSNASSSEVGAGAPGQEKWIHRLRELERRLKAEREARLLDRSGARRRLEERDAVNEELRMELERERMRHETGIVRRAEAEDEERSPQRE
jgi:chromosome segregation ATPase